jgi:hypothetical protein
VRIPHLPAAGKAGRAQQRLAGRTGGLLCGRAKNKNQNNFPAEVLRKLRETPGFGGPGFCTSKNWRCFQDIVRTYFAQHPEVTL